MRIGLGLPTALAGTPAGVTLEWGRVAEAGPFASVAVHDRLAFDSLEAVTALAGVAAVTRRVRLACLVLIAPLRGSAILLARQARTVATLAGAGRFTLGLGVGPRRDDYEASGVPFEQRGRLLDPQLVDLPPLLGAEVELLIGGGSHAAPP